MLLSVQHLVRENIRHLSPYSSARSLYQSGTLLDANESPFEMEGQGSNLSRLNRYPDGSNRDLREHFAKFFDLQPENVAIGNGSDEIIDLLVRIFCQPLLDKILILPPTFGMYRVAAGVAQVDIVEVLNMPDTPLEKRELPLSLPVQEILEKANGGVKIIFICNPNNPTGSTYKIEDIFQIIENANSIVVIDEAYADFMEEKNMVQEIKNFPNLVILKTLSKAFAMAGIRMGMALAPEEIIQLIQKVKLPYNINSLTARAILENPNGLEFVHQNVKNILKNKMMLETELKKLKGVKAVIPSKSNFFLVRFKQSDYVFKELVKKGFIVRKVDSKYGMENCLRISVGNESDNQGLIEALSAINQEIE